MDQVEFDRFADEYHDQHRANVAVTGEGPEYFAAYKIRKLRQAVDRGGVAVSRICDFGSGIGNSIPFFRTHFPRASLTSCDVSERSIALSKERYPDATNYLLIENDRIPSVADRYADPLHSRILQRAARVRATHRGTGSAASRLRPSDDSEIAA